MTKYTRSRERVIADDVVAAADLPTIRTAVAAAARWPRRQPA